MATELPREIGRLAASVTEDMVRQATDLADFLCRPRPVGEYERVKMACCQLYLDARRALANDKTVSLRAWEAGYDGPYYGEPLDPAVALSTITYLGIVNINEQKALATRSTRNHRTSGQLTRPAERKMAQKGDSVFVVDKVIEIERLGQAMRSARFHRGLTMVFGQGSFDGLHDGHVSHLQFSSRLGGSWSRLVAMADPDVFVRMRKGSRRPIISHHERNMVLASSMFVDAVPVVSPRPLEELEHLWLEVIPEAERQEIVSHFWQYVYSRLRPNILVFGDDASTEFLDRVFGDAFPFGTMVVTTPRMDRKRSSTTQVIARSAQVYAPVAFPSSFVATL